jgi:hypothetical protein
MTFPPSFSLAPTAKSTMREPASNGANGVVIDSSLDKRAAAECST